jgi:spore germination cell wall hydrolase CwlJ-like protein
MRRIYRAAALTAVATFFCTAGGMAETLSTAQAEAARAAGVADAAATSLTVESLGLDQLQDPAPTTAPEGIERVTTPAGDEIVRPVRDNRSLGELVAAHAGSETPDAETECLARAVYWESKGEPLTGQLSVAEVVINRARSGRFAPTICGVVRQPSQFSFVRRGYIPQPPSGSRDWRTAVAIAQIAMQDLADGGAPRALYFHARHARPGWRRTRVATIGNHVFYR